MFFWKIIILIGLIPRSGSHHLSFDTHLAQDCHRAFTQHFKNRADKELTKSKKKCRIVGDKR